MKKSMFTLVFAFLAFAFITSCGSKFSESIEVGVEVEDSTVVAEPAVLEEGVEVSEDAPVVE